MLSEALKRTSSEYFATIVGLLCCFVSFVTLSSQQSPQGDNKEYYGFGVNHVTQQQTNSTVNNFCNHRLISLIKVLIHVQDSVLFNDTLFCCMQWFRKQWTNFFKKSFQDTKQQTHSTYNNFCSTRLMASLQVSINMQDIRFAESNQLLDQSILRFFAGNQTTNTLILQQVILYLADFFN